ncbi:2-hydroxyacyl-CoA dehydratase subunit D [Thermodesulfobacteriota bacterium]
MTPFEKMQTHYKQRDLAAREWKEKGGKVVGYLCDSVPDEMISAAGYFPLRLTGDPWGSTEKADEYSPLPTEGFVRSIRNMLMTGSYDFLDYLVVPHGRTSIHQSYLFLLGMEKANPDLKLPGLYFLDNLHTTFYSAELYNRDRWLGFKDKLEEWSGKKITDESLSKAIDIGNENKMLLKKVAELRAAESPRISGVEALQIIGSSMFMLKEEHSKLLKDYLEVAEQFPAKDGARIFVEGSPLDNLQLYELIESVNATVVAEGHCWGNRITDLPVDTSIKPPMEAIVGRYHHRSPCSRIFPMSRRIEYCLKNAQEAKAQGVIFNVFEIDNSEAWETPDKIKELEKNGIPSLYLRDQPYLISEPDKLKAGIEEFIKAL